ncbi:MAG TPA: Gfo/Idh/MocA family oxidoreductase [Opitutus sp.]|nr:Gfo/Idh/MocA family oxidoreductase [Opitutus sp.]
MPQSTRRAFLKKAAIAGTAAALSPRSWAAVAGANSDLRVAVAGLHGRGQSHLASLARIPGVRVVALCDPDSAVLGRAVQAIGGGVKAYPDIRELLASPDVDAITIATPNHWHSLAGIWACQAGKDVYVEKPVSHNLWEGRQLVAAAEKYRRVVQAGMQIRSGAGLQEAVAWVRAGNLGKITVARGLCYKRRMSIGLTTGPQPVPASVDYDLWCGPAPKGPLRRHQFHYDWHWQWPFGDGDLGNQGVHQIDVARWFLGDETLPRHALSVGGRFGYVDDGETPNTQAIIYDYPTAPLIFEVRGLPARADLADATSAAPGSAESAAAASSTMDRYRGVRVGNVIDCEGGSVITDGYFSATAVDRQGRVVKEFHGEDRHMPNFIDVVRSRKTTDLYAPIERGHVSSALCHLGNISHRLGHGVPREELRDRVSGDPALAAACGWMLEHLACNGIDLDKTPMTLGQPLALDVANERFTGEGAGAADALRSREYRAPFVVPRLT